MAERRSEKRVCPQCKIEKNYPARNLFCSVECRKAAVASPARVAKELNTGEVIVDSANLADLDSLSVAVLDRLDRGISDIATLSDALDRGPKFILESITKLKERGYNIQTPNGKIELSADFTPTRATTHIVHSLSEFSNSPHLIGAIGDNHLGSNHERLDVLNAMYDVYESEGVKDVYNTGNWIEGVSRLNKHDIKIHGWGDQIDYFIENYPVRPGITTHFVAGDDHEGWVQRDTRIEIGRYAEAQAIQAGRTDLHYLGYVEADILLKAPFGERIMKIMHPGGGSAYAVSYAAQKVVESFQGGERPEILLIGHYHKAEYLHYRNTHIVQTGCTVDQSIFMRKQKIAAHVGGWLLHWNQAPDGAINRFGTEWFPFYNKGYYGSKRNFGLKGDAQ